LNADLSSLFTWNTKQVFVYVTAEWPANATVGQAGLQGMNEAVIWDSIITSPSADHLSNIGAAALRKLRKSAEGKSIDPSRYEIHSAGCIELGERGVRWESGIRGEFGEMERDADANRGKLTLKNQKPKYQITSPTSKVAETDDVTLHLHYNVQPWVGALYWMTEGTWGKWKSLEGGVSKKFRLPALKTKEKAKASP
jgi:signal peptidase complex subunit 3